MLRSLTLRNFTLFREADAQFSPGLNIILGENGTGKSHLMKIAYTMAATSYQANQESLGKLVTKARLQETLQANIIEIFRAERLENLVSGMQPAELDVACDFSAPDNADYGFSIKCSDQKRANPASVKVYREPEAYLQESPVFIPTREIMSIVQAFSRFYEDKGLLFDGTYFDLAMLLQQLPHNPNFSKEDQRILDALESLINGKVQWRDGKFYLREYVGQKNKERLVEMPLVAEGIRKIAMLNYLIINGNIAKDSVLFWDEPEANLNPMLIAKLAGILVQLASRGIQIVVATHSLFFLREVQIQLGKSQQQTRFFALSKDDGEVHLSQADSIEEIEPIAALDADLQQSDRYMELM